MSMRQWLLVALLVGCSREPAKNGLDCAQTLGGTLVLSDGAKVSRLRTASCESRGWAALSVSDASAALPALDGLRAVEPLRNLASGFVDSLWCMTSDPAGAAAQAGRAFAAAGWRAEKRDDTSATFSQSGLIAHVVAGRGKIAGCAAAGESFVGVALRRQ
jgi:hypothetical protein